MITGSGRAFCAGDLQDDDSGKNQKRLVLLRNSYHPLMFEIRDLGMPVVTAVNGAAAGVGMSFRDDRRYCLRFQAGIVSPSFCSNRSDTRRWGDLFASPCGLG